MLQHNKFKPGLTRNKDEVRSQGGSWSEKRSDLKGREYRSPESNAEFGPEPTISRKSSEIIDAGKKVYLGYLLLDMLNNEKEDYFSVNGKNGLSIAHYIAKLVEAGRSNSSIDQTVTIGKKHFKIALKENNLHSKPPFCLSLRRIEDEKRSVLGVHEPHSQEFDAEIEQKGQFRTDHSYQVTISCIDENSNKLAEKSGEDNFKAKDQYNENDFHHLCQQHTLTFHYSHSKKYAFETEVSGHRIGGLDQIPLYSVHISNLYQIVKYLQTGDRNILIAMATGSGKSFTQALFALVLAVAGVRGIFLLHQKALIPQLKADFSRGLPNSVTSKVACDVSDDKLHIITTHEAFFKEKAQAFKSLLENHPCWIMIDEAHEATEVELYKAGIQNLTTPILYLTATPSEFIANNVGYTINLSPQEKEKLGICKQGIKEIIVAKSPLNKAKKEVKFHLGERLALWIADIIEKDRVSTAHALLDKVEETVVVTPRSDPFYFPTSDQNDKHIKTALRWNVHLPIGEKLLLLVGRGNQDAVINCHLKLHNSSRDGSLYENGNKVSRSNVYSFFSLNGLSRSGDRLDETYLAHYEESKKGYVKHVYAVI